MRPKDDKMIATGDARNAATARRGDVQAASLASLVPIAHARGGPSRHFAAAIFRFGFFKKKTGRSRKTPWRRTATARKGAACPPQP
jgi:hypothetical protein